MYFKKQFSRENKSTF